MMHAWPHVCSTAVDADDYCQRQQFTDSCDSAAADEVIAAALTAKGRIAAATYRISLRISTDRWLFPIRRVTVT